MEKQRSQRKFPLTSSRLSRRWRRKLKDTQHALGPVGLRKDKSLNNSKAVWHWSPFKGKRRENSSLAGELPRECKFQVRFLSFFSTYGTLSLCVFACVYSGSVRETEREKDADHDVVLDRQYRVTEGWSHFFVKWSILCFSKNNCKMYKATRAGLRCNQALINHTK